MLVQAKCNTPAWDSGRAKFYYPGETYEIDTESPLCDLKFGGDKYVFEFDRNANPSDKPHDYTCDKCGEKFSTLNKLGNHVHSQHPEGVVEPVEEEEIFADRTCNICNPKKVCKSPYGLRVHQDKAHGVKRAKAAA